VSPAEWTAIGLAATAAVATAGSIMAQLRALSATVQELATRQRQTETTLATILGRLEQ